MALYHFRAKIIGRSQGRSAVAAAAYRSGERLRDERTGIDHDYERKRGIVRSEILLPRDAPERWRDRSELWNDAERAERRSNSQVAREYELALPRELDRDAQWALARDFAERELADRGMAADVCMHDRDGTNPHIHIMCPTREAGPDGFEGKNRDWNRRELNEELRKAWERDQNEALRQYYEREQVAERDREYVDRRSFEERAIDREPTRHEGPAVREAERMERQRRQREGREYEPVTDRARENAEIRQRNALRERLEASLRDVRERAKRVAERVREIARTGFGRAMADLRGRSDAERREARERDDRDDSRTGFGRAMADLRDGRGPDWREYRQLCDRAEANEGRSRAIDRDAGRDIERPDRD